MSLPARFLLLLIRFYQITLSTVMGKECRFYPSCSHYTADAIRRYGAARGGWMGLRRILRCNPWNQGGYDPVPEDLPPTRGIWDKFFSQNPSNCATDATHCCAAASCAESRVETGAKSKERTNDEAIRPERG